MLATVLILFPTVKRLAKKLASYYNRGLDTNIFILWNYLYRNESTLLLYGENVKVAAFQLPLFIM